jgi:DNA-directed RNA polymerase specialized sigma24 family protein
MNAPFAGKDGERRFAEACDTLRPQLYRFAFWLARDRQVAEDVLQEAYLRAWTSRESLEAEGALKGWLLTIVRREHARLYERKRLPTVPSTSCCLGFTGACGRRGEGRHGHASRDLCARRGLS